MKWLVGLAVIIFALLGGMRVLAMPTDMVRSKVAMESESAPNDCVAQCLDKAHVFSTASVRIPQLLPILSIALAGILLISFVSRLGVAGLASLARPPDLVKLYAHYLI